MEHNGTVHTRGVSLYSLIKNTKIEESKAMFKHINKLMKNIYVIGIQYKQKFEHIKASNN